MRGVNGPVVRSHGGLRATLALGCCLVVFAAIAAEPGDLDEVPDGARVQSRVQADVRPPSEPEYGLFGKRWAASSPDDRQTTIVVGGTMVFLLVLALLFRLVLPFSFAPGNLRRIRSGFRRYNVNFKTGRLVEYDTHTEFSSTYERVVRDGYQKTEATSTSMFLHEDFKLVDADGAQSFTVISNQSGYLGGRRVEEFGYFYGLEGYRISGAWVTTRFRKKFVGHLMFYSAEASRHITGSFTTNTIDTLRGTQRWSMLPAMGLGFAIGGSSDITFGWLLGPIVFAIAWMFLRGWVNGRCRRRFEEKELPRLAEHLESLQRREGYLGSE